MTSLMPVAATGVGLPGFVPAVPAPWSAPPHEYTVPATGVAPTVGVAVATVVAVADAVAVGVRVGVLVGVSVGVFVGSGVEVLVAVGVGD